MFHISTLIQNDFDLSLLAQSILKQYYVIPFKPRSESTVAFFNPKHFEIKDARIPRVTHGAMHAARVAAYVKILHVFRHTQLDPAIVALAEVAQVYELTITQLIHLTQIAALLHDSAREDEGADRWDQQSGVICLEFFQNKIAGLHPHMQQIIANTITFKDSKETFIESVQILGLTIQQAQTLDYLRQLVHDADCLDILRIRKTFKMKFLDVTTLSDAMPLLIALVREVCSLIHQQGDQYFPCDIQSVSGDMLATYDAHFNVDIKYEYEWSDQIYPKIIKDMHHFSLLKLIQDPIENVLLAFEERDESGLKFG